MSDMPVYLPLLIFVARICDVSVGTLRLVFVIDGRKFASSLLGFVEVVIWVLAAGGAIRYLDHPSAVIGYAGGFAAGVYVGMSIEQRIKMGSRLVRMINPDTTTRLAQELREKNWRATRVTGEGRDGPVEIVFSAVRRKRLPELLADARALAPRAVITVERVETLSGGDEQSLVPRTPFSRLGGLRK